MRRSVSRSPMVLQETEAPGGELPRASRFLRALRRPPTVGYVVNQLRSCLPHPTPRVPSWRPSTRRSQLREPPVDGELRAGGERCLKRQVERAAGYFLGRRESLHGIRLAHLRLERRACFGCEPELAEDGRVCGPWTHRVDPD